MNTVFHGGQQHGRDSESQDYHAHISRTEKMPGVLVDVPRYPSVYKLFNKAITEEEPEIQQQQHPAKPAKKVHISEHISEHEQIMVEDRNGNSEVIEESIDVEADGFIEQKHKTFEGCKWNIFKRQ